MADQNIHPDAEGWGGWSWADPVRGEHFRRCDLCGSVHPDDLVAEQGWRAEWADMKYGWPHKFYVELPNRDPERPYVVSVTTGDQLPALRIAGEYVAWDDLTDDQRTICERDGYGEDDDGWRPTFVAFGTHPTHHATFYTIHLADTDLAPDTKTVIEQRSGLAFRFDDGRISWKAVENAEPRGT